MEYYKKPGIKKVMEINAPKEVVWNVIEQDIKSRICYTQPTEEDFYNLPEQEGSKSDEPDYTSIKILGRILVNKPYEVFCIGYEGILISGIADYDSHEAKGIRGGQEKYTLYQHNNATQLTLEVNTDVAFWNNMWRARYKNF